MDNRRFLPFIIIGVVLVILLFAFGSSIIFTIEPGERAVIFKKFSGGLDKEKVLVPGVNFKAPWNEVYIYEVKENKIEENMDVLDRNGLSITVDVTVRFNPIYDRIGYLHEEFGVDYVDKLVRPEIRSAVRQVMGRFSAEEIYSTKRGEVELGIVTETEKSLEQNNISMKALLIRSIILPEPIKLAIESKLQQEQEALAYQFRLEKEKSEAERKRIAAEGEAAANNIINNSLTNNLLKMRGIEATTSLANSSNSKVIVIGGGENGLPIILGDN